MRKGLLVLFAALLAGLAAFWAVRWHKGTPHTHDGTVALDTMPELAWLQKDLQLTDAQFARVRELHTAYRPKCADMCRRIAEAHARIEAIAAANHQITTEFAAALKAHTDVHLECQKEMLNHLYETAAILNKEQAKRYLETMLPFALDFTHSESGTLHVH